MLQQTEVMAPEVRKRLGDAVKVLEMALEELGEGGAAASEVDVEKARDAVKAGREVIEKYGLGE